MQSRPPSPTLPTHRLARIVSWAMLTLIALAGCLEALGVSKRSLDRIAGLIAQIVFVRAVARLAAEGANVQMHRGAIKGQSLLPRQRIMRAAIGGQFRRHLRERRIGHRIARLICVLQDLEKHVDALVRRMKRGLTRRAPILLQRTPAMRLHAGVAAPARCADTS